MEKTLVILDPTLKSGYINLPNTDNYYLAYIRRSGTLKLAHGVKDGGQL